jgi:hypothetical protein
MNDYKPPVVTVFGKPGCGYCAIAQELLIEQGVDFTYYSIEGPDVTVEGLMEFSDSGWTERLPSVWFPGEERALQGAAVKTQLITRIERYRARQAVVNNP